MPNFDPTQALEFVESGRQDLIDLTKALIATPTPNPPGDEIAAAEVAAAALRQLGFDDIEIVGPSPQRANLICRFDSGRDGPTLLLNGHLDTKPPDPIDGWDTDPYTGVEIDGRLYGLGSADMKGPDAALIYGLAAAVATAADSLRGRVCLVLSADEEGPAQHGARYLIEQYGLSADAALIAEPCGVTQDWETLPLISRGLSCLRFQVRGTQTHSSISDRVPIVNANLEASRLLLFLDEHLTLRYPPTPLCPVGPTINLGTVFKGGAGQARIAGEAEFWADIRTLPGMSQAELTADVDRAIAAFRDLYPGVDVSWTFYDQHLAWTQATEIEAGHPLVAALQRSAQTVLGQSPPLGYFPGGTDAIWWQGAGGIPTVPAFGPGLLPNCHKPNEYVSIAALIEAAKIYALLITGYLADG
jgi:acetylornithine deacetylase